MEERGFTIAVLRSATRQYEFNGFTRRGGLQTTRRFESMRRAVWKAPLLGRGSWPVPMKRVFITGASAGIGLATAKLLTDRGDEVWGTSRDIARIPQWPRLHAIRLDLGDTISLGESFKAALREAGRFEVVINNAGSGHFGPGEFLPAEAVQAQFQTVVFAHIELCRLALASMRAHGGGRIINITSLASRLPVPFMAAYNAAKSAMASFTMSLQLELEGTNIRVIDLQPGDICTDFNDAVAKTDGGDARYTGRVEQAWRVVDRNMKAAPKPELVARRIAQLIDDANPPPRATVAAPFQSVVAPFIFRFLPQRVRIWGLKNYYGLPR
jgi:NAD(P)-dependent dehydrogenase (short-subunit alcohol dehydrogenase family)